VKFDDGRLAELTEESQDLHSDAMRGTRAALGEMVERSGESSHRPEPELGRRNFLRRSIFAAGTVGAGVGSGLLTRAVTTVFADSSADVQMLQTAASIENLAVAVYTNPAAQKLVVGTGNQVLIAFVTKTIEQHTDHAKAFNATIMALGGKAQTAIDKPVFDAVVTPALGKITGPAGVVDLAATLEDAAAQTYVKFAGDAGDVKALSVLATIAPVEAQHAAVLNAVKGLLAAGAPLTAITLPPDVGALPAAAGSIGFPKSFYPTDGARPAAEGAVA
jgi:hypothetical protein